MSPERAGSPQDQPKMSVPASPIAGTPAAEAESPIALLLAVAQCQNNKTADDDLTSLSWLHEGDVLKGINIVNPSPSSSIHAIPIKTSNFTGLSFSGQSSPSDYIDDSSVSATDSSNSSINSASPCNGNSSNVTSARMKHPHNVPYNPMIHTTSKPPYSFSSLIFMAIENSKQKALPVKEIYAWIIDHFPYFRNAPNGWKNSVRHNLSLNKSFQKVEKTPYLGKGSLWTVHMPSRPSLVQQLTRSPFHPCSTLDPAIYNNNNNVNINNGNSKSGLQAKSGVNRLPDPELFPYLSKSLSEGKHNGVKAESTSDDSLDAVDAAAVMLSLKNGPRYRHRKLKATALQVITNSPSEDHTYSAIENASSPEPAYESDDEKFVKTDTCRKLDFEDEEVRKIHEGAETLLNLAGIVTRKKHSSQSNDTNPNGGKRKRSSSGHENGQFVVPCSVAYEKPTQFRPRLLRAKRKDKSDNLNNNNNTISSNNNTNGEGDKNNVVAHDDWVRHRRELEERKKR